MKNLNIAVFIGIFLLFGLEKEMKAQPNTSNMDVNFYSQAYYAPNPLPPPHCFPNSNLACPALNRAIPTNTASISSGDDFYMNMDFSALGIQGSSETNISIWVNCEPVYINHPIQNGEAVEVPISNKLCTNRIDCTISYKINSTTSYLHDGCLVVITGGKTGDQIPHSQTPPYPNPAISGQTLHIPYHAQEQTKEVHLKIYNAAGKLIESIHQSPNNKQVLLYDIPHHLPSGLYFYRLESNQGSEAIQRFMITTQ